MPWYLHTIAIRHCRFGISLVLALLTPYYSPSTSPLMVGIKPKPSGEDLDVTLLAISWVFVLISPISSSFTNLNFTHWYLDHTSFFYSYACDYSMYMPLNTMPSNTGI